MRIAFLRALVVVALVPLSCLADTTTVVTGVEHLVTASSGTTLDLRFTCTGTPTCNGTYSGTYSGTPTTTCTNTFSSPVAGAFTMTGLDLSRAGSLQGTFTQPLLGHDPVTGACNPTGAGDRAQAYGGQWTGSSGTIGQQIAKFSAYQAPPPRFPMTVTSNITATSASASAQIQPAAQDVGNTASIFVFAHAPSSVIGKETKQAGSEPVQSQPDDGSDPCVLAQLSGSGHLSAASGSSMQAYTTGVLTSQAQAVAILNNVPTPNIAGATFYVGYGASATAMLANGVYQAAVSIPGSSQCTATASTAAAPSSPGALSGLWWNPNESGWGIHFTQRGSAVFAAWYTYDASGNPKWYVASNCALPSGATTSGACSGTLYEVSGPTFFGVAFNPAMVNVKTAGSLQVSFQNASSASMTYVVAGQTRTVPLSRQVFATGATAPAVDYTDLWWNPSESGWGMALAHQYGVMFLAWYVYGAAGAPVWYVASNCVVAGSGCSGTLYRTTGPAFGPTFDPSRIQVSTAGSVSLSFTDANNAVLSYTVNGVTDTKIMTRQLF